MKVPDQFPWASADIAGATGFPSKVIVMPVSLALKPETLAVTTVPGCPLLGLMVRIRFGIVKLIPGKKPNSVIGP